MDILEEKEAFLNVYLNYKGDSRKISFNEETEQFMWRKNNVSDTEVEYVHLMNQRWYAWLACAKSKAQAVPEGFVWIPKEPTQNIYRTFYDAFNSADAGNTAQNFKVAYKAMIEAQEPANEL